MTASFPLAGAVAVVTGAASGIGAALSEALAARGCHLALVDRDGVGLAATAARCGSVTVSTHVLDIADRDAIAALPEAVLAGAHIFFPDPWHKTRHHKRRLVQPALIARLASRLAPGGYLHCATDWEPYAQQMMEVLSAEPRLANTADGYAPRPAYRPLTKFENRGLRLGHGVWDLVFLRSGR